MALSRPHARPLLPTSVPRRVLFIGLAAAVGLGSTYVAVEGNPLARNQQAPVYATAPVRQGTLQVTVSATGPVTSAQSVPLSFKSSGKLAEVDVAVGQQVTAGQVLARMDPGDLQAVVDQAQATLNQQQANLSKLQAGATPEQVALAQAQVAAAQTTLDAAQKNLQAQQAVASTGVGAAQADVSSSQVALADSQQSLQSTQNQS